MIKKGVPKLKGIVIASHGELSKGFYETLKMFSGELDQVEYIGLHPEQDLIEFYNLLEEKVTNVDTGEGVVIFCNLLYGTPNNLSAKLLQNEYFKEKIEIISGINLPLLLEYSNMRNQEFNRENLVEIGKSGIQSFNQILENR